MDIPDNVFALVLVMVVGVFFLAAVWMRNRGRHHAAAAQKAGVAAERRIESLSSENDGLKGQVGRLEERLAVLERIATDPAERTAREIESLR